MSDPKSAAADGTPNLENPFATRFTKPGALPFRFAPGESAEQIVEEFEAEDRRGAIVGPHGTGKSTLLAALLPLFVARGWRLRQYALHDGESRLPRAFDGPFKPTDVLVIDGFEQLGWWGRRELWRNVTSAEAGLLVTAHDEVHGLPKLYETDSSPEQAIELVRQLSPAATKRIPPDEIRKQFAAVDGNVRELFFKLYDLYESQRS